MACELLAEPFRERCGQLGLEGEAELVYRPRSCGRSAEELAVELAERRATDLDRGFSTHGPHRDEIALVRGGRELRTYGSGGERRLALLALLLAERAILGGERGSPPLLLLDDVMSELDSHRRGLLVDELLGLDGQAVLTTTDLEHVPIEPAEMQHGRVARVRAQPGALVDEGVAA
jgi:DNA replication and repair protein RecF